MERGEAVVLNGERAVVVVDRRAVERIAHYLSPMLPSGEDIMVIEVVSTADMLGASDGMVVIERSALVFGIEIFHDDVFQPRAVAQVEFSTEHPVLEVVEKVVVAFFTFHSSPLP